MEHLLEWRKAPQAEDPAEHNAYYGGGIPGAYAPNMTIEWRLRWKAKLLGQKSDMLRVEIRKSTTDQYAGTVQMVLIVFEDGSVVMSMNGRAGFSGEEFLELSQAVGEAKSAMQLWRARQRGENLSEQYAAIADAAGESGNGG